MPSLNVNGTMREFDAEPDTPLLWVLREQLGLIGTKYGCGIARCGACTVHVDGQTTRSCVRPVSSVAPLGGQHLGRHPRLKCILAAGA